MAGQLCPHDGFVYEMAELTGISWVLNIVDDRIVPYKSIFEAETAQKMAMGSSTRQFGISKSNRSALNLEVWSLEALAGV